MNKKILIFTDNYPFGNSEQFLDYEIPFIIKSFDKVTVSPVESGRDTNLREIPDKIEIVRSVFRSIKNKRELLVKGLFNRSLFLPFLKEAFQSQAWKSIIKLRIWFTHLLLIRSLLSYIKGRSLIHFFNQFDVLYFYWGLRWSQISAFLPADLKAKIVVRFHGSDLYEHTNNGYIPFRIQQLNRIEKALTVSEAGKKYMEHQYPFMKGKVIISRIGTNDFGLNPYSKTDVIRIVSCSNLVPVKRTELIVKTLSLLKAPANWIHFGDGPERNKIEKLTTGLPDHIRYELKGSIRHNELMDYYITNPVDIFINVSRSEGVPVSILEAMSFGIPVIATDVGGTSEIVSPGTGFLIDPDFSLTELAVKIVELINRPDYIQIRKSARERWESEMMAEKVFPEFIRQLQII